MTRISTTLLAVVALAALTVLAAIELQPSMAQAPAASGVVALTGARIIDGTGRAPIQQGTVILNKGVIEAVGTAAGVKIPNGAARVDLSGKTIIPGLINAHAHLNFDQATKRSVRDDLILRLKTYANYGVTSNVSLGSRPVDELEGLKLRDEQTHIALDRARLYTGGLNAVGKTPEEARKSVDRLADLKVDVIKYHINGTPNDMTPDIYGALVTNRKRRAFGHSCMSSIQRMRKAQLRKERTSWRTAFATRTSIPNSLLSSSARTLDIYRRSLGICPCSSTKRGRRFSMSRFSGEVWLYMAVKSTSSLSQQINKRSATTNKLRRSSRRSHRRIVI